MQFKASVWGPGTTALAEAGRQHSLTAPTPAVQENANL